MALTYQQMFLMLGTLLTGSIITLTRKAQLQSIAEGYSYPDDNGTSAKPHNFDHPWFQTYVMFIGESACIIGLFITRRRERKEHEKLITWSTRVGHSPPEPKDNPKVWQWILVVPMICDLLGTSLAGIGLIYVDASVWQMLRGAIIIFAGILSKVFLHHQLRPVHWLGMCVVMVGLVLVGCSSVFKNSNVAGSKATLGIALIILGQLVSASQLVLEERLLKKRNFPPLQVVGMEGSFGTLLMTFVVLPAMYFIPGSDTHGSYENSLDALVQIGNSPKLLLLMVFYTISIAFYNFLGLAVTRSLTTVHRTLVDACRTIVVWAASLVIYYGIDENFGEKFDKDWGLLQIDGFAFLIIGTLLYNHLMDVPCVPWCSKEKEMEEFSGSKPKTINANLEESYSSIHEVNQPILNARKQIKSYS